MDVDSRFSRPRRRLLIQGLVAAPFMLTLASRSAHAGAGTLGTYSDGYGGMPTDPPGPNQGPSPSMPPSGSGTIKPGRRS